MIAFHVGFFDIPTNRPTGDGWRFVGYRGVQLFSSGGGTSTSNAFGSFFTSDISVSENRVFPQNGW